MKTGFGGFPWLIISSIFATPMQLKQMTGASKPKLTPERSFFPQASHWSSLPM
jgi:hypothetical protein